MLNHGLGNPHALFADDNLDQTVARGGLVS